jgi:hypothetical protein
MYNIHKITLSGCHRYVRTYDVDSQLWTCLRKYIVLETNIETVVQHLPSVEHVLVMPPPPHPPHGSDADSEEGDTKGWGAEEGWGEGAVLSKLNSLRREVLVTLDDQKVRREMSEHAKLLNKRTE